MNYAPQPRQEAARSASPAGHLKGAAPEGKEVNYYNEHDPHAAAWLRSLIAAGCIPAGDVDERSIEDVRPNELRGYTQCHFFAGIGGWSYALDLAGWPRDMPAWSGSCPCQSFSTAGKGLGFEDERHLWPAWCHLIRECRPNVVFGEQVASAIRHGWLDLVSADMEAEGYAVGAAVLGAHSVGAPHIRQRLYFVADAMPAGRAEWRAGAGNGQAGVALGDASGTGLGKQFRESRIPPEPSHAHQGQAPKRGGWDGTWRICADGKARLVEPGIQPLASRLSSGMVSSGDSVSQEYANATTEARVMRLRGYGNAIVPQAAAAFVRAWLETSQELRAAA